MSTAVLHIGNKNYSSWSLRPWLALRWAKIAFEEHLIPLGGDDYGTGKSERLLAVSPTGRVPALDVEGVAITDSLAICEWVAEQAPKAELWPTDPLLRALCRSIVCEMHSGFPALRRDLSMNIRRRTTPRAWPDDTRDDLARLERRWTTLRATHHAHGPWLFGERTLADAFFMPVATRLRTYGVAVGDVAAAYGAHLLADEDFRAWEASALAESWTIESTDAL